MTGITIQAPGEGPVGVVLAGGAGERLGGSKPTVELAGRPLIAYTLAAFAEAGIEAVVVAKPGTELPSLDVPLVTEPGEPTHPLLGIVTALEHLNDRSIVTCPCDTPFVTATLLKQLAAALAPAAVDDGDRLHPLIAHLEATAIAPLREALDAGQPATSAIETLHPTLIRTGPATTFNVNTPEDLARAQEEMRGRH